MIAIPLVIGFVIWYLLYGCECAINSGQIGRNQFLMPFQLFWEELFWVLPGGRRRRNEYMRKRGHDGEDAYKNLPGMPHFLFTHVFIPFLPLAIYLLIRGL